MIRQIIVVMAALVCVLGGCKPKGGSLSEAKRTRLQTLAMATEFEPENTYFEVLNIMANLAEEANGKTDREATEWMLAFEYQNREALKKLTADLDDWYKSLDEEERVLFMMRAANNKDALRLSRYDASLRGREGIQSIYPTLVRVVALHR